MKLIRKYLKPLITGISLLAIASSFAVAHHSTSGFDSDTVYKIEGEITQFRWTNPHASFKIDGVVEGQEQIVWTVELTAPNVLINQGWKRTSLKNGDQVTAFVNPIRDPGFRMPDGSRGGLYVGVITADGTELGNVTGGGRGSAD
jgi:hypothetical protein